MAGVNSRQETNRDILSSKIVIPSATEVDNLNSSKGKRKRKKRSKRSKENRNVQEDERKVVKQQKVAEHTNKGVSEEGDVLSTSSSTSASTDDGIITLCQKCPNSQKSTDVPEESHMDDKKMGNLTEEVKMAKMTQACETILSCIGEDPNREGLLLTPERWAKALLFLTHGYQQKTHEIMNGAVFSENHKEMVIVRDIDIHSLCEHHMLPFTGKVHVGYIPNGKVLGLSKIARIAEVYARRLQVQERLTRQIADAMVEVVNPLGVAVMLESNHFCMVMRGVQKTSTSTVTSCVRGCFEKNAKTRAEFFSIINSRR